MENALVFIDNGYLKLILKEFKNVKIDLKLLSFNLCKKLNFWCDSIYLYDAPPYQNPNSKDDRKRKKNYDKFISKIRVNDIIVKEGRCQKIGNEFHQKGVDTLLTMDLLSIPDEKNIPNIVIIACDTDFVPVLNKVREKGFKVYLFHYNDYKRKSKFSMSNYLNTACDKTLLIEKENVEKSKF